MASYTRFAFTFNLMSWAEALLLECQVALKDFCEALYFKCPHNIMKVRMGYLLHYSQLYRGETYYDDILSSFEEYIGELNTYTCTML